MNAYDPGACRRCPIHNSTKAVARVVLKDGWMMVEKKRTEGVHVYEACGHHIAVAKADPSFKETLPLVAGHPAAVQPAQPSGA